MPRSLFDTEWDDLLRSAAEQHLPYIDWRLLKAQCWQESAFDPEAISPAHAAGLMQFMPGTWEDLQKKGLIPPEADRYDPEWSIEAGAIYMAQLWRQWRVERPAMDRWALALASYNCGLRHVLEAQEAADDAALYAPIIARLPDVTGPDHSSETIGYVRNIYRWYNGLVLGYQP